MPLPFAGYQITVCHIANRQGLARKSKMKNMQSQAKAKGQLTDIRVIELGQLIAGAFCRQLMADMIWVPMLSRSSRPAPVTPCGHGGGWGDPCERDTALVQTDVTHGLVSRQGASVS